jgi:signal transduction histidine kinase
MIRVIGCIARQHDLRLVTLAGLLCFFACITATSMIGRARVATGRVRSIWIVAAGVVAGCGIWATHFVAMLAYETSLPVAYDASLTIISALIAIVLSAAGYWVALGRYGPVAGGMLAGAAIGAMHYVGMAAVRLPADAIWNIQYVVASIVIGIGAMAVAMPIVVRSKSFRVMVVGAGFFMFAIVSMHFTGMTAVIYRPDPLIVVPYALVAPATLAIAIAAVAVLVIALGLVGSLLDYHLERLALDEAERRRYILELEETKLQLIAARDLADAGSREKSNFLANMSHELRTPLNAIIGFSDLMIQNIFGPLDAKYQEYAKLIHASGGHLLDLISDVLDMAKIEAGKFELNIEHADLDKIVSDCVCMVLVRARARNADIVVSGRTDIALMADQRALRQILLNLLSNAAKFCSKGGRIEVHVQSSGDQLTIEVRDDGAGIPAEHIKRLGLPFEQVTQDAKLARGGTGLGLALVYALVAQHGGAVQIESQLGQGTTVRIALPLDASRRHAA